MKRFVVLSLIILFTGLTGFSQSITSISPDSVMQGQSLNVTITGSGTSFSTGSVSAYIYTENAGYIYFSNIKTGSNTDLTADISIPAYTKTDNWDLKLYDNGSYLSLNDAFKIYQDPAAPHIKSVSPTSGYSWTDLDVTITGKNTTFNQSSTTVRLDQKYDYEFSYPNSITKVDDTTMVANFTLPYTTSNDLYDVVVDYNTSNNLILTDGFTVIVNPNPPQLTSISPDTAMQGENLTVTISGTDTRFSQGSSSIYLYQNGTYIYMDNVVTIDSTTLTANLGIPYNSSTLSQWSLTYYDYNSGLNLTMYDAFTILENPSAPRIDAISPDTLDKNVTQTLEITCSNTNFTQASATSVWLDNNYYVYSTVNTVVNDTVIQATFNVPSYYYSGYYNLNISDGIIGTITKTNGVYVNPGRLISVNPISAEPGDSLQITITGIGTNFNQASQTTSIWLDDSGGNSIYASSTTPISDESIAANFAIPNSTLEGVYNVNTYNFIDYTLTLSNAFSIGSLASACTSLYSDCVWPGDANNDGIANMYDVLELGLNYGDTGPARSAITTDWNGYYADNWADSLTTTSTVNKKNTDCNGDGIIGDDDIAPITANYGKSHSKKRNNYNPANPDLYFEIITDDIAPGTNVDVNIMAGTSTISLYGLAFQVIMDMASIEQGSVLLEFDNSWISQGDTNAFSLSNVDITSGEVDGVVVRTDKNSTNSFGRIATLSFTIASNVIDTIINIGFGESEGIESDGDTVVFNQDTSTQVITDPTTGLQEINTSLEITVVPNPFNDYTTISFSRQLNNASIDIIDLTGKTVRTYSKINANNVKIYKHELSNGVYLIKLRTDNQSVYLEKLVVK